MKQLVKQSLHAIGLDVRRWPPPPPPPPVKPAPPAKPPPPPKWTPPDPALLPDVHLYDPRFSPWIATEGEFHQLFEQIRPYTIVTRDRCYLLRALARHALGCGPGGEFWECGVYKGGTAMLLAQVLASRDNPPTLRLFDTFAGLPDADPTRDFHKQGEFGDTAQADVAARVAAMAGGRDFARIHAGRIPQTLAGLDDSRIAFAHVDVDLYESVLDCCRFIYPRLLAGGVMLFDDYGFRSCPGARKAVDEFFADKPEAVLVLPTGQALVTVLPTSRRPS